MLVFIDNQDSFTYNLVQYFKQLNQNVAVIGSDATSLSEIASLKPSAIILGPGPGTPQNAGITCSAVHYFAGKVPLFGVCLGHQAIAQTFGASVVRAHDVMHGRTSQVYHSQHGLFYDLPNPTPFTRYHSLIVDKPSVPHCLQITAWTTNEQAKAHTHHDAGNTHKDTVFTKKNSRHDPVYQSNMDNATTDDSIYEVMAIAHQSLPIYGVQFHPESILSGAGMQLLQNFIALTEA